jgi:hypothetical protein
VPCIGEKRNYVSSNEQELLTKKVRGVVGGKTKMITDYRPEWMRNPKTGKNLEIDVYLPEFALGIEYQGYRHFYGHGTDKRRERDIFKIGLAKKRKNVRIIEFFADDLKHPKFSELFFARAEAACRPSVYESLLARSLSVSVPRKVRRRIRLDYRMNDADREMIEWNSWHGS